MAVWQALQAGDEATAEDIIEDHILPVSRLGFQGRDLFYHVHKALLVRDGLFDTAHVRAPTHAPDTTTQAEIARLIARPRLT
jgi:dihydrodipicolinate synthase/N-acetylneuraminate lyase